MNDNLNTYNLNTSIEQLYADKAISVRTLNVLKYANLPTIGAIKMFIDVPEDLLKLRNFGHKSMAEVVTILSHVEENDASVPFEVQYSGFEQDIQDFLTAAYEKMINEDSSSSHIISECYPTSCELFYTVINSPAKLLKITDNMTLSEFKSIRIQYTQYLSDIIDEFPYHPLSKMVVQKYILAKKYLDEHIDYLSYYEKNHFISPTLHLLLENIYQSLCESLTPRPLRMKEKYFPSYESILPFIDKDYFYFAKAIPEMRSCRKTIMDFRKICISFKNYFDKLYMMSDAELCSEELKARYPFLSAKQRNFVNDYREEYGHHPLFYILYNYMRLSEERSNKIYSLLYGIFDDRQRTIDEVASIMDISPERVRQIVSRQKEASTTDLVKTWNKDVYNSLTELPYILEDNKEFLNLKAKEKIPCSFSTFIRLFTIVFDYRIQTINGIDVLLNSVKMPTFNFKKSVDNVLQLPNARFSSPTTISIDSLLVYNLEDKGGVKIAIVSPEEKKFAKALMLEIIPKISTLPISKDGCISMQQNYVDVMQELYGILERKKKPMTAQSLFDAFKRKFPDHRIQDVSQIKAVLFKDQRIKAVGKTSLYGLASWEHVFFGSIRDLLIELLQDSDVPLHIEELFDNVILHFPDTNIKSIASSMGNDTFGRFVEFDDGYFGLTSKEYSNEFSTNLRRVKRFKFSERLDMFQQFVEQFHRFPTSNGGEMETSLHRWHYNITYGIIEITPSEKEEFNRMIHSYDGSGYPRNSAEHEFQIKCEDYKSFVMENHELPSITLEPDFYYWFKRSKENYNCFIDQRRQYFIDLMNFILSLGFSI